MATINEDENPSLPLDDGEAPITSSAPTMSSTTSTVIQIPRQFGEKRSKRFSQMARKTMLVKNSSGQNKDNHDKIPQKAVERDGMSTTSTTAVPTIDQEFNDIMRIRETHGTDSWQARLLYFLHSNKVKYLLVGLLVIDILILFVELAVAAFFPTCELVKKAAISCGPFSKSTGVLLSAAEIKYTCERGVPNLEYPATCDPDKHPGVDVVENVLFGMTVFILSVFFVELTMVALVLGPFAFFKDWLHAIDYVVVSISLALEIAFHVDSNSVLQAITGLLVFGRLWRFIRIGHGVYEASKQVLNEKLESVLLYLERTENLLEMHGIPLPIPDDFEVRKGHNVHY